MPRAVAGLHHVTAIASSAAACTDFYVRVLGLRLVKRTVNFDAPGQWHFYFGDDSGTPGSLLTFFVWTGARRGRPGAGMAGSVALAVPAGALEWWRARLRRFDVPCTESPGRFGERSLALDDPDGLRLELVEHAGSPGPPAILGLHAVTLTVRDAEPTRRVLGEALGLAGRGEAGALQRFSGKALLGANVDLLQAPAAADGRMAAGAIHHVAFRADDDVHQQELAARLGAGESKVSAPLDRRYFRSCYFREPGGVLLEIATDGPGMSVDESPAQLGETLCLPPWLEERRERITAALPEFRTPVRQE